MDPQKSIQHCTVTLARAGVVSRRLLNGLLILLLVTGMAVAADGTPDVRPRTGEIVMNPQAAYTFAGWDQLGRILGLPDEWGLKLGGYVIPEFTWVASGGIDPNATYLNLALGIHASLDTGKAFCLPGGTLGIEFLEATGGAVNDAAGSVQKFTTEDVNPPAIASSSTNFGGISIFFDDKLIFHIGKMNGSGIFGNLQVPVITGDPWRHGADITNLLFVPVGLNPTLFSRLPSYYNTAYGAVVHVAPTKDFYASYGIFDASAMRGIQTGLECAPSFSGYYAHFGELGYSWVAGEEKMPGRIGLGGWLQTGEAYTPALTTEDSATGYYLFAAQRLWYLHPGVDNAGFIGYFQFGHTSSESRQVNSYLGAGLSGVRLIPGRPTDQVSIGVAYSWLNDTPGAGVFFYPDVKSASNDLRNTEFMFQAVYQTNFYFPVGRGFFGLHPQFGYTYIPNPGQRPDLPPAHVFTLRLTTLF